MNQPPKHHPGRCPSCNARSLYRRASGAIFCNVCGDHGFSEAEVALYQSQSKGRKGAYAGLAARIRQALGRGPATMPQLVQQLGAPDAAIRRSLKQMMAQQGGISVSGERGRATYSLWEARRVGIEVDAARPYAKALPITVGRGSRWGAGLV